MMRAHIPRKCARFRQSAFFQSTSRRYASFTSAPACNVWFRRSSRMYPRASRSNSGKTIAHSFSLASWLGRDVALKALPSHLALEPERRARFEREAQVLASLNHPNIAAIYGFEELIPSAGSAQPSVRVLALELIEGPTLADRIAQGPIPVDDAIPIARQITEALAAAHERGVVHRDL